MALVGTKATFKFFQIGDVPISWSESWFLSGTPSIDLANELAFALTLAQKRVDCCGSETALKQIVVSDLSTPRRIRRYTPPGGGLYSTVFTTSSHQSDFGSTALQCVKRDPTRTSSGILFMRGIPDEIVDFAGAYTPNPAFIGAFGNFQAQLLAQPWYFLGETTPRNVRQATITNVTQGADGRPIVTVLPAVPPLPGFTGVIGQRIKVNISGVLGAASINGQRVVYVQDATTLVLNRRTPMFVYLTGGSVQWQNPNLLQIASFTADRIVERKVGAPFLRFRGRSKVRKLA
jgi:hypothetical protein